MVGFSQLADANDIDLKRETRVFKRPKNMLARYTIKAIIGIDQQVDVGLGSMVATRSRPKEINVISRITKRID